MSNEGLRPSPMLCTVLSMTPDHTDTAIATFVVHEVNCPFPEANQRISVGGAEIKRLARAMRSGEAIIVSNYVYRFP